jgi:flagellar M-ring protein FliF
MDYVKVQLDRLQQQLAGLSASQKMLTFTLVAIMVMTLLWWGRYAGQNEMAPVLEQALSHDDISRMTARIQSRGIPYRVVGDRVLVPVDRRFEVIAELGYAQLLPRDTKTGFDEIVRQMSPWDSTTRSTAMLNNAREQYLAEIIRRFPGVANAMVVLDPTSHRGMGRSVHPSGTVFISMRDGAPAARQLVEAAADVLAGAQAGLSRSRVKVVVDGVSFPVRDRDDATSFAFGTELIDQIKAHERHIADRIGHQLSYIPGVLVSVTVNVNTRSVRETKTTPDVDNYIHVPRQEERRSEETTMPQRSTEEPGALPNMGMDIGPVAGGGGANTSRDEERTTYEFRSGESLQQIVAPAGDPTVVAASVRVPRSYFVSIYNRGGSSTSDPDDADLQPLMDQELTRIRNHVKATTGLRGDEAVMVDVYTDIGPALAGLAPPPASAVGSLVNVRGKEIVLGALAVISLFMAMMIVRKGPSATSPRPTAIAASSYPAALPGESLAGQAGEGDGLLQGMELDEATIRSKQMLEQVSNMVKEDPDAAAGLVKRWLSRP